MNHKPERATVPTPLQLPVFEYRGKLVADSREVAPFVEKDHAHLLRDIRRYIKVMTESENPNLDSRSYFIEASYMSEQKKSLPCYYCTEMGCEIIAHKMTGDRGIIFTAQYVKAFHAMRALLLERASPIWQDTRSLGKDIRRQETDAIKRLVDYATAQGSRNAARYYTTLSKLANHTAGIVERDTAQVVQLTTLLLVEKVITKEIVAGIEAEQPYKAIYQAIKDKLAVFSTRFVLV